MTEVYAISLYMKFVIIFKNFVSFFLDFFENAIQEKISVASKASSVLSIYRLFILKSYPFFVF